MKYLVMSFLLYNKSISTATSATMLQSSLGLEVVLVTFSADVSKSISFVIALRIRAINHCTAARETQGNRRKQPTQPKKSKAKVKLNMQDITWKEFAKVGVLDLQNVCSQLEMRGLWNEKTDMMIQCQKDCHHNMKLVEEDRMSI